MLSNGTSTHRFGEVAQKILLPRNTKKIAQPPCRQLKLRDKVVITNLNIALAQHCSIRTSGRDAVHPMLRVEKQRKFSVCRLGQLQTTPFRNGSRVEIYFFP